MVAPAVAATAISAASSILGGLFGKSSSDKAKKAAQAEAAADRAMQYDFAQNGIQWKAADAIKAGLHPLAALGAQTMSASPVSIGSTADMSMPNALNDMGQNISRAVGASQPKEVRAMTASMNQLALERASLENELLRTQISSINRPTTPGLPFSNSVSPGQVDVVADKQTSSNPGDSGSTAGLHPAFQNYDLGRGRTVSLPVSDGGIGEALEGLPLPYAYAKMAEMLYKRYDHFTPGHALAKLFRKGGK